MSGVKRITIRKALPKKQPALEKHYYRPPPGATRTHGPTGGGFNVLMTPSHGVSGYATTGTPSSFTIQNRATPSAMTPGVNVDPSSSAYDIRGRATPSEIASSYNPFNAPFEPSPYIPVVTPDQNMGGLNYNAPTFEEELEQTAMTPGLGVSEKLQASMDPLQSSFVRRRLFDGLYSNDPVIQNMVEQDGGGSALVGATAGSAPYHKRKNGSSHVITPSTGVRTDHTGNHGTQNNSYDLILSTNAPGGQAGLADIIGESAPPLVNDSNTTTGVAPSMGGRTGMTTGNYPGSNTPYIAATIIPTNPTPYTTLGPPPQPPIRLENATGALTVKDSRYSMMQTTRVPIQHRL